MKLIRLFLLTIFLGNFCAINAQEKTLVVETDKKITASNEDLLSLLVKVSNKSNEGQDFTLTISADKGIRNISNAESTHIKAGETLFLPLRLFIEKNHSAGTSEIKYNLIDKDKKIVAESVTSLVIAPKKSLKILPKEPQILINRIGDSIKATAVVYNNGNLVENIELVATFPQYDGVEVRQSKKIKLKPFTNQEVSFSRIVDREYLKMELFTINIAGLSGNKDFFGNTMVVVQNASADRKFINPNFTNTIPNSYQINHVTVSARNALLGYESSYNLDAHTEFVLGNAKTSFNINATQWANSSSPALLTNTWLKVENKNYGIQLGNLTENDLEINLVGRGAEVFLKPKADKKTSFVAGIVEKSYNLLDPLDLQNLRRGYSAFGKSTIIVDDKNYLVNSIIYDTDALQKGIMNMNEYHYNNGKNTQYDLRLGYGYASAVSNSDIGKSSFAAGFNMNKNFGKYNLSSTNYYSSAYYPGIRRGNTISEQRLYRNFSKTTLWIGFSLNNYDPKNIDPQYQFNSSSTRLKTELGVSLLLGKLKISFLPQFSTESSNLFINNYFDLTKVRFSSENLSTIFSYSTPDYQNNFNLMLSQGLSKYDNFGSQNFIYKGQFNWYYKSLMLSATYQHGNFMLYEGTYGNQINNDNEKISAIANYKLDLLNHRLNMNFSGLYNYDKYAGRSLSFSSTAEYRLKFGTKIFGNYNINKYLNGAFKTTNNYYQIGVTQDLPNVDSEKIGRSGNMEVLFYYDLNNNGHYDPEIDKPASDIKVKINNTIFITQKSGMVKYRKVPFSDYTIKSMEDLWYMADQKIYLDKKNLFLTLPLQRTSQAKGKLQYEYDSKTQYEIEDILAGIGLTFKNEQNKIFNFYTNDRGEITAYLPVGHYKVTVDAKTLQKNVYVENNFREIEVKSDNSIIFDTFILKVREKKIEVKKFGIQE